MPASESSPPMVAYRIGRYLLWQGPVMIRLGQLDERLKAALNEKTLFAAVRTAAVGRVSGQ